MLWHLAEGIDKCNDRLNNYTYECKTRNYRKKLKTISNYLEYQLTYQALVHLKNETMSMNETQSETLVYIAMVTATKLGIDLAYLFSIIFLRSYRSS